jgi:predicted dehydrogenase
MCLWRSPCRWTAHDAPDDRARGEGEGKDLKVGVGLMVRHCEGRKELYQRIRNGEIGDIVAMRAYRMGSGGGTAPPKPAGISELMYQISKFHAFLWLSGGVFSDYYIHQIDECSWMKDAWPVEAMAIGGRHYRGDSLDQNFDTYSVQYTYPDGAKLYYEGRNMPGVHNEFASYAHGTKGSAVITTRSHHPGQVRIYNGQKVPRILTAKDQIDLADKNLRWAFPQPEKNPQQLEWDNLVAAIRQDKPYNEVKRGAEASMVASHGSPGGAHGADRHVRPDAELRARVRARGSISSPCRRTLAAAARPRWKISGAAAGHRDEARVLSRIGFFGFHHEIHETHQTRGRAQNRFERTIDHRVSRSTFGPSRQVFSLVCLVYFVVVLAWVGLG